MLDYTDNDLLDLELKYKNDQTVLDLIAKIKDLQDVIYEDYKCGEAG